MGYLERLSHLPQPSFESGEKTPLNVVVRRATQRFARNTEVLNQVLSPFLSPEIRNLKCAIQKASQEADICSQPAFRLLRDNLIYLPGQVFLRASPFHADNWLRDTFIGTLFLNQPEIESHLLSLFETSTESQQLPTARLFPGTRKWLFDDESTMLGLIWRAKLLKQGVSVGEGEIKRWQGKWDWIRKHVRDSFYFSPAGTERSWFDTFRLPSEDVIAYNQGIYAVAAIAAQRLSLENGEYTPKKAIERYQSLTHESGRLQFSRSVSYKDLSSLFGEFLSLAVFRERLLPDETVIKTVEMHPRTQSGQPVVIKDDDSFLSPLEFNRPYPPGDYHNGAEWPVFSAAAQAVGEVYGLRHDRVFWQTLFDHLVNSHYAEYIHTNTERVKRPLHSPRRETHLWNTTVFVAAGMVLDKQELEIVLSRSPRAPQVVCTEAAQMPDSSL